MKSWEKSDLLLANFVSWDDKLQVFSIYNLCIPQDKREVQRPLAAAAAHEASLIVTNNDLTSQDSNGGEKFIFLELGNKSASFCLPLHM